MHRIFFYLFLVLPIFLLVGGPIGGGNAEPPRTDPDFGPMPIPKKENRPTKFCVYPRIVRLLFKKADLNKDGKVTEKELEQMLKGMDGKTSMYVANLGGKWVVRSDFNDLMNHSDDDQDGAISWAELDRALAALPPGKK